ncbi:MAG: dockerin type I repeat-containing protein, partial [Muribaculaceae bacterium]|nr:dockerin type I repeat-containing protein [Muribaculaceae bacterium]
IKVLSADEYKITVSLEENYIIVEKVTPEPQGLRGDVNDDKKVDISDATLLINYLLYGDETGVNKVNANCDLVGGIDISDATALINFLLYGTW